MDDIRDTSLPVPAKARRRRHSPEFKQKIVELVSQPDVSVAALAQQYQLNANLIHRWCRDLDGKPRSREFIPLSLPKSIDPGESVRIELGSVSIHWPLTHIDQALPWIKALQS